MTFAHEFKLSITADYFALAKHSSEFLNSLIECYQNPKELYGRILKVNTTVFTIENTELNEVCGYLFFDDRDDSSKDISHSKYIYNGYAIVNEKYRNDGVLKELLLYANNFYLNKCKSSYNEVIFFAVTSNPIALKTYYKIFPSARPLQNGTICEDDLRIVGELKKYLLAPNSINSHPFAIKTNLPQRYLDKIRGELRAVKSEESILLESLDIDEQGGDRFLFYWKLDFTVSNF